MLAYAPRRDMQSARPGLFAIIALGHVAVIGTVMATKMVIERTSQPPIWVENIEDTTPPPPEIEPTPEPTQPVTSVITTTKPIVEPPVPVPLVQQQPLPPIPSGPIAGTGTVTELPPPPVREIVRKGPRFATAADLIRPPYPETMRASEKEAVIKLRLSIDERGRVVAVEPVGRIEPAFLDAARRHILKVWRYQPATEDGKAVRSSTIVSLRFEIGEA